MQRGDCTHAHATRSSYTSPWMRCAGPSHKRGVPQRGWQAVLHSPPELASRISRRRPRQAGDRWSVPKRGGCLLYTSPSPRD
eukprot:8299230-Alexandrium_andersonii.AAC.1